MKNSPRHLGPVAISVLASLKSPVAAAAVDMFLVMDGVKGETQDAVYKGQYGIDVLAWSWQLSQPLAGQGGGGGASSAVVRPISIMKYTDSASTDLIGNLLNGTTANSAKLVVRKADEKTSLEYIVIDMTNVVVTSVSNGGSGGEERLTEQVFLGFSEACITYTKEKPDGTGEPPVTTCYTMP